MRVNRRQRRLKSHLSFNHSADVLSLECEVVERDMYMFQVKHYFPAEKQLLAGKLVDQDYLSASLVTKSDLELFLDLEDRYFKSRKRNEEPCVIPEMCNLCELSTWSIFRKKYGPGNNCSKMRFISWMSYEDWIFSLLS